MDWTFSVATGRHTATLGGYNLSVWPETPHEGSATARWDADISGDEAHGGTTAYGFATVEAAQAWCVDWVKEHGGRDT